MITPAEFNALDENAKAEITWSGTFLADREQDVSKVQLYSLENFYVEVFYDPLENRIVRFNAFREISFLTPYL